MKKIFVLIVSLIFLSGCSETWNHMTKLKKPVPGRQAGTSTMSPVSAPVANAESTEVAELHTTINDLTRKVDELSSSINQLTKAAEARSSAALDKTEANMLELVEEDIMESSIPVKKEIALVQPLIMEEPVTRKPVAKKQKALPLKKQYAAAYNLYKNGSYNEAIDSFDALLKAHPNTDYSDNALYWTGESYYSMGNFSEALSFFQKTGQKFPKGNKTPASQLKAGYAYIKMQNKEGAKKQFQKVIDLYPFSPQAEIAIRKLNAL